MKNVSLLLFLIVILLLNSCISLHDSGYNEYRRYGRVKISNPVCYKFSSGEVGNELGKSKILQSGDSVIILGYRYRIPGPNLYSILNGKDTVFVSMEEVQTIKDYQISLMSTSFTISNEEDEIAWGRANYYASNKSDLKIQTQTNFLVENYTPFQYGQIAFKITRQPMGKFVQYEVKAVEGGYQRGYNSINDQKAKECVYYIRFGE